MQSLFLRLAGRRLQFAQLKDDQLEALPFRARPTTSLLDNLNNFAESLSGDEAPEVNVVVDAPVVPVPLNNFNEEDCAIFLDYCIKSSAEQTAFYDLLPNANAALVFGYDKERCEDIRHVFPNAYFTASLTHIQKYFDSVPVADPSSKRMLLYLHERKADIVLLHAHRLLALNSYEFASADDILYYVFNIAQKMGLRAATDAFYILSDNNQDEAEMERLDKAFDAQGVRPTVLPLQADLHVQPDSEIALDILAAVRTRQND